MLPCTHSLHVILTCAIFLFHQVLSIGQLVVSKEEYKENLPYADWQVVFGLWVLQQYLHCEQVLHVNLQGKLLWSEGVSERVSVCVCVCVCVRERERESGGGRVDEERGV